MQGYFDSKAFKQLLNRYEEARSHNENFFLDSDQLTDIAEYYHWMGRTDEALAAADDALHMFHGATGPLVLKARIALLNDNNAKKAIRLAEEIEDKSDLDYYYIKAEIMLAIGKAQEADLYLESYLDQMDDNDYCDYVLDAATLFVDYEQTDLARKWLKRSNEADLPDFQETLGRIHYLEKDYVESERIFENLLDQSPYNTYYWDMMAYNQLAMDHLADAITSCEYALAINPTDESALLYMGQALMRQKNYEDAVEYLQKYGDLRPCNIDGPLNIAICHINQEDFNAGLHYLHIAEHDAEIHCPDRLWDIYQEEVFVHSQTGQVEQALGYIDKMEQLKDNDYAVTTVLRGNVYLENLHPGKARECFEKALKLSGSSPAILMRVAVSLYDNNYLTESYGILSSFGAEDFRQLPQAHAYLAISAYDLGYREEFLTHLKEAVEKAPEAARQVFAPLFPEELEPTEYYEHAQKNPNLT